MRACAAVLVVLFAWGNSGGAVARGDQMTPKVERVIAEIDEAFRGRPWPAKFALEGTYDEALIDRDFASLPSLQDSSEIVRHHRNALHALTHEGFRTVLPLYLRTGLAFPKSEVMDHVAYYVNTASRSDALRARLAGLNDAQLASLRAALATFLSEFAAEDKFLSEEIGKALATMERSSR